MFTPFQLVSYFEPFWWIASRETNPFSIDLLYGSPHIASILNQYPKVFPYNLCVGFKWNILPKVRIFCAIRQFFPHVNHVSNWNLGTAPFALPQYTESSGGKSPKHVGF